jgi:hypothetical protein
MALSTQRQRHAKPACDLTDDIAYAFFNNYITKATCKPQLLWKVTRGKTCAKVKKSDLTSDWATINKLYETLNALVEHTNGGIPHQCKFHKQFCTWLAKDGMHWAISDTERALTDLRCCLQSLLALKRTDNNTGRAPRNYGRLQIIMDKLVVKDDDDKKEEAKHVREDDDIVEEVPIKKKHVDVVTIAEEEEEEEEEEEDEEVPIKEKHVDVNTSDSDLDPDDVFGTKVVVAPVPKVVAPVPKAAPVCSAFAMLPHFAKHCQAPAPPATPRRETLNAEKLAALAQNPPAAPTPREYLNGKRDDHAPNDTSVPEDHVPNDHVPNAKIAKATPTRIKRKSPPACSATKPPISKPKVVDSKYKDLII